MMYDRASIAVDSIKGNYAKRVAYYDSMMMQQMEENHVLLSDVQRGLVKEEFVLYLQPKCNMATAGDYRIWGLGIGPFVCIQH